VPAFRPTILGLVAAVSLAAAPGAQAQSPSDVVGPYDGQIPFKCDLQQLGTGTEYPDPNADPLCVEFDKTNQNVTDFGIVDFTSQEPARVAAAGDKCFYFQRDHWTGSIQQGSEPELWHWDGDYWYDRARGVGGVSVRNFRIAGQPQSASPFVPPAYAPYFDQNGGGGVEALLASDPDPSCAPKVDTPEERNEIYGDRPAEQGCIEPGGGIRGRRVGRARLGAKQASVRKRLGAPSYAKRQLDSWCLIGKGELRAAYDRHGRVGGILTSGRGQSVNGVARGDRVRRAERRLALASVGRFGGYRIMVTGDRGSRRVVLGASHSRIRWVALLGRDRITGRMLGALISHVS
jgi:hypothetical protein